MDVRAGDRVLIYPLVWIWHQTRMLGEWISARVEVADGASILLVNADGERMAATHLEFEQWCELGWVRPVPRSAHEELERLMRE